eukprot:3212142-Rhodomonas_salina.2
MPLPHHPEHAIADPLPCQTVDAQTPAVIEHSDVDARVLSMGLPSVVFVPLQAVVHGVAHQLTLHFHILGARCHLQVGGNDRQRGAGDAVMQRVNPAVHHPFQLQDLPFGEDARLLCVTDGPHEDVYSTPHEEQNVGGVVHIHSWDTRPPKSVLTSPSRFRQMGIA